MNWFKKFFGFGQDEEVKSTSIENENPTRNLTQQKDVETRITYHYPKGQFRFPLIPDENKDSKDRTELKKKSERKGKKHDWEQEHIHVRPKHKEQMPKVDYKSKQPFRPTEIPSPLYGRKKKLIEDENLVEYELSSFIKEETPPSSPNDEWIQNQNDVGMEMVQDEAVPTPLHSEALHPEQEEQDYLSFSSDENVDDVRYVEETEGDFPVEVDQEETIQEVEMDLETRIDMSTEEKSSNPASVEEPKRSESKPERSHLPFNVLMLKQDKRSISKQPVAQKTAEAEMSKQSDSQSKGIVQAEQGNQASSSYQQMIEETNYRKGYQFPKVEYLVPPAEKVSSEDWLIQQRDRLDDTLENFNVKAKVVKVTQGPSVTQFEVQPQPGVKVNKITNLTDDIKLSLAAKDIRMEAPIPGKHTIGIEVPNHESRPVWISEVISSEAFQTSPSPLTAALGLDISGQAIVTDLGKMPHGLIAGATGSGKSVCINSILVSLLYKATPEELKLLLIDPKMVELAPYNHIPHLVSPVITDVKAATAALKWAVEEMERRYELFAHTGVRNIKGYNDHAKKHGQPQQALPYLVIVIDELADLMMMSPADVEEAICRIAQKARACGIHLLIATQRPSVDVITGLIKANVPTRVAFSVSSQVDSRTIIDTSGAERLLGKGDMLLLENGSSKPVRLQGTFVSDEEIDTIIEHVRAQGEPNYLFQQEELLKKAQVTEGEDELFYEACEFVIDQGGASTSLLQRHFRIGYNRAARLIEMMEDNGIVSESRGSKPRDVLISGEELEGIQDTSTII